MATVSTAFGCGGNFDNPERSRAFLQSTIDATERAQLQVPMPEIEQEKENSKSSVRNTEKPICVSPSAKIALLLYKGEKNKAKSLLVQTQNALKKRYEHHFMGSLTASGEIQKLQIDIDARLKELNSSY